MSDSRGRTRQGTAGQMMDVLFLLVILFGTLFVTTFIFAPDDESDAVGPSGSVSIQQLPIGDAEKAQYERMVQLGVTTEDDVRAAVDANEPRSDKYSFSWLSLAGTVGLTAAYLLFVYRVSFREYREVVTARFGAKEVTGGERLADQ